MLRRSSENELLLLQDSFSLASSAEKYLVSVKYDSLKKFSSGSLLLSNSRFSERTVLIIHFSKEMQFMNIKTLI